jgi:hypothetical protein
VDLSELQWWNPKTRAWELEREGHPFQALTADGAAQENFRYKFPDLSHMSALEHAAKVTD